MGVRMRLYALALSLLGSSPETTVLLEEQYALEAENCTTMACLDEGLTHIDNQILLLLGRRAAVVRHAQRLAAAPRSAGSPPTDTLARVLTQARAYGVPEALARQVFTALFKAASHVPDERPASSSHP